MEIVTHAISLSTAENVNKINREPVCDREREIHYSENQSIFILRIVVIASCTGIVLTGNNTMLWNTKS